MKKTLKEAADDVLRATASGAPKQPMQSLEVKAGQDDRQENLGGDTPQVVQATNPDATKPIRKAKEPGAKPPIGQENDARTKSIAGNNQGNDRDLQSTGPNKVKYKSPDTANRSAQGQTEDDEMESQEDEYCEEVELEEIDPNAVFVNEEGQFVDEDGNVLELVDEEGNPIELSQEDIESLMEDDGAEEEGELTEEGEPESVVLFDREAIYEDFKQSLDEELGDLLSADETLTEDFKKKARTVFEAAVMARVNAIADVLEENFVGLLAESVEDIKTDLTEKTNDYLSYVAEEWMKENELAVEQGLRTELTEDFMAGLKQLFLENYIEVPEDKINIVEELASAVEEAEGKLNEQIQSNVELTKKVKSYQASEILATVCEGLTDVQKDKMLSLCEGLDFTTEGEYKEKVVLVRENYFPQTLVETTTTKPDGGLNEAVDIVEDEKDGKKKTEAHPDVAGFVSALNRSAT